jgi:hypothetical protein
VDIYYIIDKFRRGENEDKKRVQTPEYYAHFTNLPCTINLNAFWAFPAMLPAAHVQVPLCAFWAESKFRRRPFSLIWMSESDGSTKRQMRKNYIV